MTMSPAAFAVVSELVRREAAIVLEPGKEYLVDSRLTPLARAAGLASAEEYVERVLSRGEPAVRRAVVEAMTTNETSWFRDGAPYVALREVVLPELLEAKRLERRITVWSAACSSGQEAYSVAMTMLDAGLPADWTLDILATDINEDMVEQTRAGRYSQLAVDRGLPAPYLARWFRREGCEWQVADDLRRRVTARRLNLAAPFPALPRMDVVLLRNVLIYFDVATKVDILRRVQRVLHPEGVLVLGTAETTLGLDESWRRTTHGRVQLNRPPAPLLTTTAHHH